MKNNKQPDRLLAYLRLFRLPNVFTAMADVAMGYLVVRNSFAPIPVFACLLLASSLLYISGMVLNDVFDFRVDKQQRPQRPLPSGQISLRWARWLGFEMLVVGVALGWLAGYMFAEEAAVEWRSGAIATLLAVCIVLYDGVLKKTPIGPIAMGGCRFFNVLLGMSFAATVANNDHWRLYFDVSELLIAGGIGVYIVGVTWFARTEAVVSSRLQLGLATVVMLTGVAMLAIFPSYGLGPDRFRLASDMEIIWPILLLVLSATIIRRCASAVLDPTPRKVQDAVKQCIFSLIILDASVCLAASRPEYAIAVVALLVPTIALGKYVYST